MLLSQSLKILKQYQSLDYITVVPTLICLPSIKKRSTLLKKIYLSSL